MMRIASKIYEKSLIHRYDDDSIIHYFSLEDFKDLKAEPYKFKSDDNAIQGYFYFVL